MKIGRNEKCWCKSGKKYKYCHYGRESQAPVSTGEAFSQSKKIAARKGCSIPSELRHECNKKIIDAHTISKSSTLIEIADETNHVLGLKIDLATLSKNKGKLIPERIGVNQASTFKGFCSKHDKELFSCVEDQPFTGSNEQCFALMYRSVAKELYAKEGSLLMSEFIKNTDKGRQPVEQLFIQKFAADNQLGVKTALKELSAFKAQLDNQLLGNATNNMSHLIIEASNPMPIVVSSVAAPVFDFDNNQIQDLADLTVVPEYVVFNSFSSEGKGYVVFSWLKDSNIILGFINTLKAIDQSDIFTALVRFFFGIAENIFISPMWWDALAEDRKEKIQNLIMIGVNPFTKFMNSLLDDGIDFSGWDIDLLKSINF